MTYAVIKTGGKQYRVAVGDKLKIEQIPADVDSEINLDQVLMIGQDGAITVGKPLIEGATVSAKIIEHGRGEKIRIFIRPSKNCQLIFQTEECRSYQTNQNFLLRKKLLYWVLVQIELARVLSLTIVVYMVC
jgi:large subunit ribosomal protein L21